MCVKYTQLRIKSEMWKKIPPKNFKYVPDTQKIKTVMLQTTLFILIPSWNTREATKFLYTVNCHILLRKKRVVFCFQLNQQKNLQLLEYF